MEERSPKSEVAEQDKPEEPRLRTSTSTFLVCHIGGGLHHAFPSHGEGFCPFNDVAVAARVLQTRGLERIAIVDLDVHHGNGTAFIFESDPRVFTFSMHQQHNYPMWKPRGSLDIGLPDGAHDATYLRELERALPAVMAHRPQCVFYLAGADPYEDDQLGGLRLTKDGLRQRDRMVIDAVRAAGVPLVITLAGGYARRVEDTVAIHVATIEGRRRRPSDQRQCVGGLQIDDLAALPASRALLDRDRTGRDVLVLVRLVRRVGRRRPQIRDAEEDQLLVAEAGRRIEAPQPLDAMRHQADLLFALAPRRVFRRLALVQPARRELPHLPIERRAVLLDDAPRGRRPRSESARPTARAARSRPRAPAVRKSTLPVSTEKTP